MPNYVAEFFTDGDYATRSFKARSPQDALKKARVFYDERTEELMFQSYDGGQPVTEISVRDAKGCEVALWQDDELRLRLAADDMLEALELCVDCLEEPERDKDGTPSTSALDLARAAIAKAKGQPASATGTSKRLPPDPENMNLGRADAAAVALRQFCLRTGCDYEDSLGDLLCDLMHWSGRENFDFDAALCRARGHYEAETVGGQV